MMLSSRPTCSDYRLPKTLLRKLPRPLPKPTLLIFLLSRLKLKSQLIEPQPTLLSTKLLLITIPPRLPPTPQLLPMLLLFFLSESILLKLRL